MMRYLPLSLLALSSPLLAAGGEGEVAAVPQLQSAVGVGSLLQVMLALVFVVALIVATAWLLRRFSGTGLSRNATLRVLAGVSVGQRERVVLVQAGEVQLLLGVAPGAVRTLHTFDQPLLLEGAAEKGGERFAERLMSAMNAHRGAAQ